MTVTGKQVTAGVEIVRILLKTMPRGRSEVSDIIHYAKMVGSLLAEHPKDADAIHKAIVERMVTIKVVSSGEVT